MFHNITKTNLKFVDKKQLYYDMILLYVVSRQATWQQILDS